MYFSLDLHIQCIYILYIYVCFVVFLNRKAQVSGLDCSYTFQLDTQPCFYLFSISIILKKTNSPLMHNKSSMYVCGTCIPSHKPLLALSKIFQPSAAGAERRNMLSYEIAHERRRLFISPLLLRHRVHRVEPCLEHMSNIRRPTNSIKICVETESEHKLGPEGFPFKCLPMLTWFP